MNYILLFSSCPKSLIGHPDPGEKTGFRFKDCRNDNQSAIASNKGFSLVELLIAVSIMIIALVPLMDSITASFKSARAGKRNTILLNYARDKMENILALEFDSVNSSLGDTVTVLGETVSRDVTVEFYDGNGDAIPDPDLKKITVKIEGVQLETLLTDI